MCRRVGEKTGLVARYGSNTFVVRYPQQLAEDYPRHVVSTTLYGRLVSPDAVVNTVISLHHDDEVRYTCCAFKLCGEHV